MGGRDGGGVGRRGGGGGGRGEGHDGVIRGCVLALADE